MKVRWTEQAFERLAEIEEYLAQDNPVAAPKLLGRIIDRGEALEQFPERGRVVPEIANDDVREVFEGNYRFVYRVRKQFVQILTVFERHRPLPRADIQPSKSRR